MIGKKFLATRAATMTGSPLASIFRGNVSTVNSTLSKKNITPLTNCSLGAPGASSPQISQQNAKPTSENSIDKKEQLPTSQEKPQLEDEKPS